MIRHMCEAVLIALGLIHLPSLVTSVLTDDEEWDLYQLEAYVEYADEFTRLFNSMEYKRSKNGRSMIRREGETSFRFVKGA
jgi:hypothetical protein